MRQILFLLIFLFTNCKNSENKENSIRKARAEALTITKFLNIGVRLDSVSKSYSELKFDSIEAIDFKLHDFEPFVNNRDTIVKRRILNKAQSEYLLKVLDNDGTYKDAIPAMCFYPHSIFVFYQKDEIIAHYSVCLGCMKVYSTIKPNSNGMFWRYSAIGEYGGSLFSTICHDLGFSHCEYSKVPKIKD